MPCFDGIHFDNIQPLTGAAFTDFFVNRHPAIGPGWFVFGRDRTKYGLNSQGRGAYIKVCARPDQPKRWARAYSGRVYRGWRTKREAQAIADRLNAMAERGELPNV